LIRGGRFREVGVEPRRVVTLGFGAGSAPNDFFNQPFLASTNVGRVA